MGTSVRAASTKFVGRRVATLMRARFDAPVAGGTDPTPTPPESSAHLTRRPPSIFLPHPADPQAELEELARLAGGAAAPLDGIDGLTDPARVREVYKLSETEAAAGLEAAVVGRIALKQPC